MGGAATLLRNALWALFGSQPLSHGLSVQTNAELRLWDDAAAAQHFLTLQPFTLQPYCLGIPPLHPVAKDTFLLKDWEKKKATHTKTAKWHTETPHEAPSPATQHPELLQHWAGSVA